MNKLNDHFGQAIKGQSSLACALIATAFIENALMTLLSKFFLEVSTAENMFKAGGPLGDLSKCADMAYCLGFLHKNELNNIKEIGNIRNIFAHSPELIDFDHPNLKDHLTKIIISQNGNSPRDEKNPLERLSQTNREKFSLAAMLLHTRITLTSMQVKRQEAIFKDH